MMKLASSRVRTIFSRQLHYQPSPPLAQSKTKKSSFLASAINSVVKIFAISRITDPLHPWLAHASESSSGSGFVISDRMILTNAHVVSGAKFIEVTKLNSGTKYRAEIKAFGHQCDLAILLINDENFWKDLEPLKLVQYMPNLLETVCIAGYPQGGDNISITKGVISRIDIDVYTHSRSPLQLPTLQVDAAINSGNSGGPVFIGNEVVGVAFESFEGGDNMGYVIPSPIVLLFLASFQRKKGPGFCSLGLSLQPMENPMMRKYFKMKKHMTGVLVTNIDEYSQGNDFLEKDDIILEVDGINIEDDGKVFYENRFWIHLNGVIALKKPDDQLSLKVLRRGNIIMINVKSMPIDNWYITDYPSPSYYIFAGLVFTESIYGGVKISQVLEGQINQGYTSFSDLEVRCVNGKEVSTLQHFCEMIIASTGHVRIELEDDVVVLVDLSIHKACHDKLLQHHKVMYGMSEDIEEVFPQLGEESSD